MAQTATTSLPPQPGPALRWINPQLGMAEPTFRDWAVAVDRILRGAQFGALVNAVNDAAAQAAGVPVNGLYRNGNAVQIRLV